MEPSVIAFSIMALLFVLLAMGMPIGFAMATAGFFGSALLIDMEAALALLGQTAFETAITYDLSVVPQLQRRKGAS